MQLTKTLYRIGIFLIFVSAAISQTPKMAPLPKIMLNGGLPLAAPGSTLPAIDLAFQNQFEWVKIAVQLTQDRQHVVLPDSVLARITHSPKSVSGYTLAELQKLDAGTWFAPRFAGAKITALKDVFEQCHLKINLLLDCQNVAPDLLVDEILSSEMAPQVIVAAHPKIRNAIQQRSQNTLVLAADFTETPEPHFWRKNKPSPGVLQIPFGCVTPDLMAALKRDGIKILVDATGAPDRLPNWLGLMDWPVDWILTNKGDELLAARLKKIAGTEKPVRISAHRGVLALAPENTLAAYQKAIDLGLDFIEIDVRPTRDKILVSVHDGSLKRTTGLDRPVSAVTLSEIRELSAGEFFGQPFAQEKVPTLEEIFRLGRGKIGFYLDFKDGDPAQLAEMLRRFNVVDDCVIYGSLEQLLAIRALEPGAKIMPPLKTLAQIKNLVNYQPYAFDTAWESLSPELIKTCHEFGVKVFADAMDDHENITDFLEAIRWGIDCIQTDEPLILFRAVEKYLEKE
jgi:glycerophosphoryl diester phosphodiesterase